VFSDDKCPEVLWLPSSDCIRGQQKYQSMQSNAFLDRLFSVFHIYIYFHCVFSGPFGEQQLHMHIAVFKYQ